MQKKVWRAPDLQARNRSW